jgi:hypothetical protein
MRRPDALPGDDSRGRSYGVQRVGFGAVRLAISNRILFSLEQSDPCLGASEGSLRILILQLLMAADG